MFRRRELRFSSVLLRLKSEASERRHTGSNNRLGGAVDRSECKTHRGRDEQQPTEEANRI